MLSFMINYFITNLLIDLKGMIAMKLQGIIPFAHDLLNKTIKQGEIVVDATCGNGNDTLFLSKLVGDDGHVYAFDIQKQAIETTRQLLKENKRNNVSLIHDSHALIERYINDSTELAAAVFNLGYLPRSDKSIITKPDSTITAIDKLLPLLKRNGLLVLVVYAGHPGGMEEKNAVLQFVSELDQQQYFVLKYGFINLINEPPFVIAIEKK